MRTGVYQIRNIKNGKRYIGSAVGITFQTVSKIKHGLIWSHVHGGA